MITTYAGLEIGSKVAHKADALRRDGRIVGFGAFGAIWVKWRWPNDRESFYSEEYRLDELWTGNQVNQNKTIVDTDSAL